MDVERGILFLNFAFIAEPPKIQQLVFSFFVRGQYRQIVVSGLHVLDHRGQSNSFCAYDFERLERDDPEVIHAEHTDQLIANGSEFSAEDVFFGEYLDRCFECEFLEIVDEELGAVDVEQVGSYD